MGYFGGRMNFHRSSRHHHRSHHHSHFGAASRSHITTTHTNNHNTFSHSHNNNNHNSSHFGANTSYTSGGSDFACGGRGTGTEEWTSSVCSCHRDCAGFLESVFCYYCSYNAVETRMGTRDRHAPVQEGECGVKACMMAIFDIAVFLTGTPFFGTVLRTQVVDRYNIDEDNLTSCVCTSCLPCCSLAQLLREIKFHGEPLPMFCSSSPYSEEDVIVVPKPKRMDEEKEGDNKSKDVRAALPRVLYGGDDAQNSNSHRDEATRRYVLNVQLAQRNNAYGSQPNTSRTAATNHTNNSRNNSPRREMLQQQQQPQQHYAASPYPAGTVFHVVSERDPTVPAPSLSPRRQQQQHSPQQQRRSNSREPFAEQQHHHSPQPQPVVRQAPAPRGAFVASRVHRFEQQEPPQQQNGGRRAVVTFANSPQFASPPGINFANGGSRPLPSPSPKRENNNNRQQQQPQQSQTQFAAAAPPPAFEVVP